MVAVAYFYLLSSVQHILAQHHEDDLLETLVYFLEHVDVHMRTDWGQFVVWVN